MIYAHNTEKLLVIIHKSFVNSVKIVKLLTKNLSQYSIWISKKNTVFNLGLQTQIHKKYNNFN